MQFSPPKPGTPGAPVPIEIKSVSSQSDAKLTGLRARSLLDAWAYAVAHPDAGTLAARQDEIRSLAGRILPIFDVASASGLAEGLTVQTPAGSGSVDKAAASLGLDTRSGQSRATVDYDIRGLKVDSVFIPAWARPLIPNRIAFGVAVTGFDVAAAARTFTDVMDLSGPKPVRDADSDRLMKAFLPGGKVIVDLPASTLVGADYTITWEGRVEAQIPGKARTHMTVTCIGLDGITKALQGVKERGVGETVIGLYMARAVAKPGPNGALVWVIDFEEGGELLVNGAPVGPKAK